jgi:cytochrome c oxidase subunit 2
MNSTQLLIAVGFTTLVLVSLALAVRVIRSTNPRRPASEAELERITRHENHWAIAVVVALLALMAVSAFAIPYGDTSASNAQVVNVSAFQFGWQLEPNTVKAGRPVEFRARSKDVQHGFGIYDGAKLLAQVQVQGKRPDSDALFGDEQRIVQTFDEPGTYEVLCLEFCGVQHQNMKATFEVTP